MDEEQRQEYLAESARRMAQRGWLIQGVIGSPIDSRATYWYYTVGLTGKDHPEFTLSGLVPEVATPIINDISARVFEAGKRYREADVVSDLIVGHDIVLVTVDQFAAFPLSMVEQFFPDRAAQALQLVLPDAQGRHPWDEGYTLGDLQDLMYTDWRP